MIADAYVANLNSGITVVERWVPGEPAPWDRLVVICKENSLWVTNLRMNICSETVSLPSHAEGYWHVCKPIVLEGVLTENSPVVRGIGHVKNGTLHMLWGVRTQTNEAFFYHEDSAVNGQQSIIWRPK